MFASFLALVLSADFSFDKAVARCQGADLEACLALARFYANPGGAHRDDAKAATLLQLLCTKNNGEGCFELGVLYAEGRGVAKDAAKANQLWDKGGTRGSRAAGQALLSGKAGEANPDEVKRLAGRRRPRGKRCGRGRAGRATDPRAADAENLSVDSSSRAARRVPAVAGVPWVAHAEGLTCQAPDGKTFLAEASWADAREKDSPLHAQFFSGSRAGGTK
jgi:TPR repeat protein